MLTPERIRSARSVTRAEAEALTRLLAGHLERIYLLIIERIETRVAAGEDRNLVRLEEVNRGFAELDVVRANFLQHLYNPTLPS